MAITLKVKPEVLKNKAQSITADINTIEGDINKLTDTIIGTRKYWQGDASDKHTNNYNELKDDLTRIIKRLKEHPTDLEKMAGIYEDTEKKLQETISALPVDAII